METVEAGWNVLVGADKGAKMATEVRDVRMAEEGLFLKEPLLQAETWGLPHTCSQIEGGGRMTRLQAVRAIYKDGALVFADPELVPRDGAEVVVTFLEERGRDVTTEVDPIRALRGRGKGEGLVEKLLQSRREDQERDEQSRERLRA